MKANKRIHRINFATGRKARGLVRHAPGAPSIQVINVPERSVLVFYAGPRPIDSNDVIGRIKCALHQVFKNAFDDIIILSGQQRLEVVTPPQPTDAAGENTRVTT